MADFNKVLDEIEASLKKFQSSIPELQQELAKELFLYIKRFDLNGRNIRISAANIRMLTSLRAKLLKIISSDAYNSAIKDFAKTYQSVAKFQNQYFGSVERDYKPPALSKALISEAIVNVVESLSGTVVNSVVDQIYEAVRTAATQGSEFTGLNEDLRKLMITEGRNTGLLEANAGQVAVDSLNRFSGQYSKLVADDLGFEWYRYSGNNISTTRPWCRACTKRKWFHISEIPAVIQGEFEEFHDEGGELYKKTGLPKGMIEGTDITNFQINRGGYNCGHQWRPGSESIVPIDIVRRVKATNTYRAWAIARGKKIS